MVAAEAPAHGAGFEVRVLEEIRARAAKDLDVVDEAFAVVKESEEKAVDPIPGKTVVHESGPLDGGPGGLGGLIGVPPVGGEGGVGVGVHQLQA